MFGNSALKTNIPVLQSTCLWLLSPTLPKRWMCCRIYRQLSQKAKRNSFYVSIDRCDASIEAVRQSRQNHLPFYCIGNPVLAAPDPLLVLPDEYAITKLGFDAYVSLCLRAIGNFPNQNPQDQCAGSLRTTSTGFAKTTKTLRACRHEKLCEDCAPFQQGRNPQFNASCLAFLPYDNGAHRPRPLVFRFGRTSLCHRQIRTRTARPFRRENRHCGAYQGPFQGNARPVSRQSKSGR